MKFVKSFIYVLLFIIPLTSVTQDLHYDQYTTDDGLPSNTIYEIVQDSTGLLWIGTEKGLVSFDGVVFKQFTDPRLKDNDILEVEISKDGHVTFSNASNQYCRIEEGRVVVENTSFDTYMVLKSTKYDDFLFDSKNCDQLYKYENGLVKKNNECFHALGFDSLGNIIYFIQPNKPIKSNKLATNLNVKYLQPILCYANFNATSKGVNENNYYVWRSKEVIQIDSSIIFKIDCFGYRGALVTNNKTIVLTREGALIYEPSNDVVKIFLPNIIFNFAYEDREGNVWLSTDNDGLLKVLINDVIVLPHINNGSEITDVNSIGENLFSLTNSDICFYDTKNNLINSYQFHDKTIKTSLVIDKLVYIFSNKKIYAFDFKGERKFSGQNELISKYVYKVGSKVRNEAYLASRNEIFLLDEEAIKSPRSFENCVFINHIGKASTIAGLTSSDVVYVGTDLGLFYFFEYDSMPKQVVGILNGKNISCLSAYNDKTIWVGTSNDGLYYLDKNQKIDSINIIECIGTNVINDVVQFDNFVFVATPVGVVRFDLRTQACSILNEFTGLFTNSVNKIHIKSLDSIYLSQNKELVMVDNSLFDIASTDPNLVLKDIYVNNLLYNSKKKLFEFNHDNNNIEFQFDFYTYRNVGNKMLQHKFVGDSLWNTSKDLNLRFPSLEPSTYSLEVRGMFANTEHTGSRSFEFTIRPPWWQTLWARLLGLCTIGLSIYLYVARRSRRIQEQEASKREYLQQINKVKDQALQLQMNPHFIFNAMNAIQNFITSGREKDATMYLAKFAKLIRLIFEYSNTNLISMEAELEFVNLYVELEQLRFNNRISCALHISESIDNEKDILLVPPLLIQPIIENSFKHGLFHKLNGGELSISYDLEKDTIVTVIEDNGIGREASRTLQGERFNKDRHSGMKNITQRLEIFKFNMPNYENNMLVEDLYCEGKPCGTKTTIKVTIDENKQAIS